MKLVIFFLGVILSCCRREHFHMSVTVQEKRALGHTHLRRHHRNVKFSLSHDNLQAVEHACVEGETACLQNSLHMTTSVHKESGRILVFPNEGDV